MYVPYVKQEEPLKVECQHFIDCIRDGRTPITSGEKGMGVVRILEMASHSLKQGRNGSANGENGHHKNGENGHHKNGNGNGEPVILPARPIQPATVSA
jgi:predicted dehydrogenase